VNTQVPSKAYLRFSFVPFLLVQRTHGHGIGIDTAYMVEKKHIISS
jgi:hypothetical protein